MIKVRAGQVWECIKQTACTDVGCERKVTSTYGHKVSFTGSLFSNNIHEFYKFIPQNDLEWLAVNVYKFPTGILNYSFWDAENIDHGIENTTFQQWQNMRYHLGLDVKPHYRLIGGEWVKQ